MRDKTLHVTVNAGMASSLHGMNPPKNPKSEKLEVVTRPRLSCIAPYHWHPLLQSPVVSSSLAMPGWNHGDFLTCAGWVGLPRSCVMPVTASSISIGISPYIGVSTCPGATEFTRTPDAAAYPREKKRGSVDDVTFYEDGDDSQPGTCTPDVYKYYGNKT